MQFGGYTLVRNSKDLFESFGFEDQPVIIGLIIFMVCHARICKKYYRAIIFLWRCFKYNFLPSSSIFVKWKWNRMSAVYIFHLNLQWDALPTDFQHCYSIDTYILFMTAHHYTRPTPSEFLPQPCQQSIWISGSLLYSSQVFRCDSFQIWLHLPNPISISRLMLLPRTLGMLPSSGEPLLNYR